jgi:predicted transposase YbfD/YdcC
MQDPRASSGKRHQLLDVLIISICAVICGANGWVAVEEFGHAKQEWLSRFLALPHGIPSHDTFGRIFALLDPEQFQTCFLDWVSRVSVITRGQVVAIDGKTLRRSHDHTLGKAAIEMVSAWAEANGLVLGQLKVQAQSNEIPVIPQLLQVLEVEGCIVTTDAIGCQKGIVQAIVQKGADYVLALKKNQGRLYTSVKELFQYAHDIHFHDVEHDFTETISKGHGRIEIRKCWTLSDPEFMVYLPDLVNWEGLCTLVMVSAERREETAVTHQDRYYITSLDNDAQQALHAVRRHWSVENELHWVLDIAFREDESRVRKDNGPQNFAILRHMALNLLKQESTATCGISNKRLKAAWSEDYLCMVLAGLAP